MFIDFIQYFLNGQGKVEHNLKNPVADLQTFPSLNPPGVERGKTRPFQCFSPPSILIGWTKEN